MQNMIFKNQQKVINEIIILREELLWSAPFSIPG